ncbi:MAG: methyl-accepting chemotaxis protein [bacterium]
MLITLALVCSCLVLLTPGGSALAAGAAVFAGGGLAAWLAADARSNRMRRAAGECRQAIETSYALAAVMSHTKHITSDARRETLEAIEHLSATCAEIGSTLAGIRRAYGDAGCPPARTPAMGAEAGPAESVFEQVAAANDRLVRLVSQVSHDAKELVSTIDETACSMSGLDAYLQQISRNGEELEASADAANSVALEGAKTVEQLEKENQTILGSMKGAAAAVDDLGRWSEEVGKIIEVIEDITDETNLLALNAAIIAAQAGEHGKAFAVVAEEIRGLAERTSSSTKEISDLVKSVEKNVANVGDSVRKSMRSVERGEALVRNTGGALAKIRDSFAWSRNLARQIAASSFEHKADSSGVLKSMRRISDGARHLASSEIQDGAAVSLTTIAVRALGALSPTAGASRSRTACLGQTRAGGAAGCAVAEAEGLDFAQLVGRGEKSLDQAKFALDSIGGKVLGFIGTVEKAADLARLAVAKTPGGECPRAQRCWEIVGCGETERRRCGAYESTDWRCFLVDRTACSRDQGDKVHGEKRCYDCPAFKSGLERLTSDNLE